MKCIEILAIGIALSMSVAATGVSAQVNGKLNPASPCCTIVSIDAATGFVTAKTISTGKTFRFKIGQVGPVDAFASKSGFGPLDGFGPVDGFVIKNRVGPVDGIGPIDGIGPVDGARLLAGLRVGQKVWANLAGLVSINGAEPCCGIVLGGIAH